MRIWQMAMAAVLLSSPAWSQGVDDSTPFTSAIVCGQCHKDIHGAWLENRHSRAATGPVFLSSLREAGEDARPLCLTCHAPTTTLTRDFEMRRSITKESVTCDFCHSMVESRPGEDVPFRLEVGLPTDIKRGPYKDADPKDHGVAYSEIHVTPLICASCHEYATDSGVPILSTYSEYLESPYPRRIVPCQGCHMPIVMANVVDPKVKRDPRTFINLHRMPGGHAVEQLQRAIELEWDEIRRLPGQLQVRVALSNVGAGHRVPTGIPTRKLVLEVEARSASGKILREQKTYQKVVVDAGGNVIVKDSEMFLLAAGIRRDNRIRPGERRLQELSFLIPGNEKVDLTARLVLELAPLGPTEEMERIPFASIETTAS